VNAAFFEKTKEEFLSEQHAKKEEAD